MQRRRWHRCPRHFLSRRLGSLSRRALNSDERHIIVFRHGSGESINCLRNAMEKCGYRFARARAHQLLKPFRREFFALRIPHLIRAIGVEEELTEPVERIMVDFIS